MESGKSMGGHVVHTYVSEYVLPDEIVERAGFDSNIISLTFHSRAYKEEYDLELLKHIEKSLRDFSHLKSEVNSYKKYARQKAELIEGFEPDLKEYDEIVGRSLKHTEEYVVDISESFGVVKIKLPYKDEEISIDFKVTGGLESELPEQFREDYTLADVVKSPWTATERGFTEACNDLLKGRHAFVPKEKGTVLKDLPYNVGVIVGFGLWSVPHELLHAGVNKLTGGVNGEIVINRIFGGDLLHYFFPDIESKLLFPFIGGYVEFENASYLTSELVCAAPYLMTPLGIYLLQKGAEKENLPLTLAGAGLVAGHAGGIIGDFFGMGQLAVYGLVDKIHQFYGETFSMEEDITLPLAFATGVVGFLIGIKFLAAAYRLSKGTVNSIRNLWNEEDETS